MIDDELDGFMKTEWPKIASAIALDLARGCVQDLEERYGLPITPKSEITDKMIDGWDRALTEIEVCN